MANCEKYSILEKGKLVKEMDELLQEMENQRKREYEQLQSIQDVRSGVNDSNFQSTSVYTFGDFDARCGEERGAARPCCSNTTRINNSSATQPCCNTNRGPNISSSLGLKFDDVISAFKTFSGDDRQNVRSWIESFEQQCNEFRFTEIQIFIIAKRMMRNNAKLFIEFESAASNWQSLKTELIEEFGKTINSSLIHQKLRERKKKPNESTMAYLYEMLSMASLGDVDISATITYTIDGLPGSAHSKNFMFEATTLSEFKAKLKSYEILQGRNLEPIDSKKNTSSTLRCLNCGSKSH